jgi:nucleoside-diphosphate-sugar epimerase
MRIAVTGGSGKAGTAVVQELIDHGHRVRNVDLAPDTDSVAGYRQANLDDFGQTIEALQGMYAVIHLAAIVRPGVTEEVTFRSNVGSTYNVFNAACILGLQRVVWASSETTMGLPFDQSKPYFPIDEEQPTLAKSGYALSKVVGEEMARYFNSRYGMPFVGLRFSHVWDDSDYAQQPTYQHDARIRSWNAWGYVDRRDVAQACRRAVEADTTGAEVFIVAAGDTVMDRPNKDLLAEVFPKVEVRGELGDDGSLLSTEKARRMLGYEPKYSWRPS